MVAREGGVYGAVLDRDPCGFRNVQYLECSNGYMNLYM